MPEQPKKPLDPYKTICVCYHKGKEVGRIPAASERAERYINELVQSYGDLDIKYEENPTGGLLVALHGPIKKLPPYGSNH